MCNANKTGPLLQADFAVAVSKEKCQITVTATHNAGCPTVEASGMVAYLNSSPIIIGLLFLAIGTGCCFFGAKVFDEVLAGLGALVIFTFVAVVASAMGGFSSTVMSIFSILFSLGAAGASGWLIYKTVQIQALFLGGVAAFFLGFLFYAFVVAQLITQSVVLMWITLIGFTVFGAYYTYKNAGHLIVQITSCVGAYMMARGISYFIGGFPNESYVISQLQIGNFSFPGTAYVYVGVIVALAFAGHKFQEYMKFELTLDFNKKIEKEGITDNLIAENEKVGNKMQ